MFLDSAIHNQLRDKGLISTDKARKCETREPLSVWQHIAVLTLGRITAATRPVCDGMNFPFFIPVTDGNPPATDPPSIIGRKKSKKMRIGTGSNVHAQIAAVKFAA